MADSDSSSILSKLESSPDLSSIHQLFSNYLKPFSPVLKTLKTRSKFDSQTSTLIRSLAKQHLSFLTKSLSLIPKRLTQTPRLDSVFASGLFETYKLCLECFDALSSQLICKPYSLQTQRLRLIHCYEVWGRYEEAEIEAFSVLEFLRELLCKGSGKVNGLVVPEVDGEECDKEIGVLVLEVVVMIVKCVANAQRKDEEHYIRVLTMVDQLQPWLGVIGVDGYDKLHRMLVSYLSKSALFLVADLGRYDENLVCKFCTVTLTEYTKSSLNDQLFKFARKICSSLFLQLNDHVLCGEKILTCVLDAMAAECKISKKTSHVDFLEFVDYCAMKCRNATVDICGPVASHFDKLARDFSKVKLSPVDLIMRLYAITLSMSDLNYYSRGGNSKTPKAGNNISVLNLLFKMEDQLQSLPTSSTAAHTRTYMPLYFNALKFLCEPLSELINSERKNALCGFENVSCPIKLSKIEGAFHQFRLAYRAFEEEKDVYENNSRSVLAVAIAAFTLSFTTKQNIKESTGFLKHLISTKWVQSNGLKYLYASLHNVGIVLYKTNRLKEATKSLKLCCQAAWDCILHFCKIYALGKDESSSDLTEDSIAAFVSEACAKSDFLLNILYQRGSEKITRILRDFLESWSVAHSKFDKIPSPVALVKQWVKIECKEIKNSEAGHRVSTIFSLMSSSNMPKKTLGILLEQKSRIFIANARESRACGVEGLNDCLKYLTEVISTTGDMYDKDKDILGRVSDTLAEAYCLYALCIQEAEPNSKFFLQNIDNALKLWLSYEHSQSTEPTHVVSQNILTLLFHVGDLLSLKGYMEAHSNIYEMIIRIFKWKDVPMQECLAMLWQSRSLSHVICASPVNDSFIMTLSKHSSLSKSMEFWKSCMEKSKPLEVSFRQSFSVISTLSSPDSYNHESTDPHLTNDGVKQAASDLINEVPLSNKSVFLAAHLYYDLGERMISKGLMIEALSYAKEAYHLRIRLFKKTYLYSVQQHNDIIGDNGEVIQKRGYAIKSFHMHPSVATSAWSYDKGSSGSEDFILTPWNVLRCYLESILQVGTVQEIVGNGFEAEALLLWGKNISIFQGLPIFSVSFSIALGKLYRKQQLWHLAEKELDIAKGILVDSGSVISCTKCRLLLEVTVEQEVGDLVASRINSITRNKLQEDSLKAEIVYRCAVKKLKLSEWKNCLSNPEGVKKNAMFCDALLVDGNDVSILSDCGKQAEQEVVQPKVTRKGKKTGRTIPHEQRVTSRVTRSSKQKSEEVQNAVSKLSERKQVHACEDVLIRKETQKSKVDISSVSEIICVSDCWHCVPSGVMKSSSLTSIIEMNWECIRRRHLLRLLIRIGKCLGDRGETRRAIEIFLEGISVLVNRSMFHPSHPSISLTFLGELIKKNMTGDVFTVEHASILYNICWLSLKSSCDNDTRNQCLDMSFIPIEVVVSGLKQSFVLCREVPELFQKVSQLLAVLYTLSPSNEAFYLVSSSSLSESQWASYFHQASLGTRLNYQLFSRTGKQKDENNMHVDDLCLSSLSSLSLHRLAPESVHNLEEFILKFYQGLPRATIICISMLGEDYANWLRNLLPCSPLTHAWMMFSRLNSECAPVVIVLPIDSVLAGSSKDDEESSCSMLSEETWSCPWGHTIIDEVAPLFRKILEENFLSSSGYALEDTKENRLLWWNQRRKLDQWLSDLLRDVEDLWFGPWKHLLLGKLMDCKYIDPVGKKLMKDLKSKCKIEVHESVIKAVIGGAGHVRDENLAELIMKKGCYIGGRECRNDEGLSLVSEILLNAIHELGEDDFVDREPVILVPDFEIQMLPWESLPILRNQEVYRMPSVASISCTYDRCSHFQEKVGAVFPMIDPQDAYFLVNPGGDLKSTEAVFRDWFKDQNLEGTAGSSPGVDELSLALKKHDLFIYIGHGSGEQYIPGGEIQKLDRCAATLLMGCSSGSLFLNGSYTPKGAPLYYLYAGSPAIISNLWDVTDKDIDRFGKAMLEAWLTARSNTSVDCVQCNEISDKLKELNMDGGKGKTKKKTSRSKSVEVNSCTLGCKHRPKIGSFMGKARGACTLPFLIGAAPVCYGVPTGIWNKDL